jgi:hypothetical protein
MGKGRGFSGSLFMGCKLVDIKVTIFDCLLVTWFAGAALRN